VGRTHTAHASAWVCQAGTSAMTRVPDSVTSGGYSESK
jgi:hypothetical protein